MVQDITRMADYSASQDIPYFHHMQLVNKSPPLDLILSQLYLIHILSPYSFMTHFNIILPFKPTSQKQSFLSRCTSHRLHASNMSLSPHPFSFYHFSNMKHMDRKNFNSLQWRGCQDVKWTSSEYSSMMGFVRMVKPPQILWETALTLTLMHHSITFTTAKKCSRKLWKLIV
jgi:hypothetical protein